MEHSVYLLSSFDPCVVHALWFLSDLLPEYSVDYSNWSSEVSNYYSIDVCSCSDLSVIALYIYLNALGVYIHPDWVCVNVLCI